MGTQLAVLTIVGIVSIYAMMISGAKLLKSKKENKGSRKGGGLYIAHFNKELR